MNEASDSVRMPLIIPKHSCQGTVPRNLTLGSEKLERPKTNTVMLNIYIYTCDFPASQPKNKNNERVTARPNPDHSTPSEAKRSFFSGIFRTETDLELQGPGCEPLTNDFGYELPSSSSTDRFDSTVGRVRWLLRDSTSARK